ADCPRSRANWRAGTPIAGRPTSGPTRWVERPPPSGGLRIAAQPGSLASLRDPRLHRRTLPLVTCVGGEPCRHLVARQDESVQHEGEVGIRDAPLAEEMVGAGRQP